MFKNISIVIILLGLTNTISSQTKIIPKSVEARMNQNRQSQKSTFDNISVIYSFSNQRLESRDQAQQFDKYVATNYGVKIKSCATSDAANGFYSVLIAEGYVTPDDLKFITNRAGGDVVAWKSVYALNENVNISESSIDTRHKISKSEYDELSQEKKDLVKNNPDKYVITNE